MQTVYLPKAHTYCLGVNVMNHFYSVTVKKVKCVSILPSVSFERFIYILKKIAGNINAKMSHVQRWISVIPNKILMCLLWIKSEKSPGGGLTCAASLLTTSSCLLLSSGVPGQLPPPSSSPPLPKELWDKETASMSGIHNQYQYLVTN